MMLIHVLSLQEAQAQMDVSLVPVWYLGSYVVD
jgi:hypothetical protein